MRGVILGVHEGRGILTTDEQRRVEFPISEWRSPTPPIAGDSVDFTEADGEARAVYRVPAGYASASAVSSAGGVSATTMGAISVGCLALGFIIPIVPTIAALILGILGASQARAQGDENALVLSRIGWIGAALILGLGVFLILIFGAFLVQMFGAWAAFSGWHWGVHGGSIFW